MTTNITHASWMNPCDNGEWEAWNPQWTKAIMDHLGAETEEHVAAVFATNEDPTITLDNVKHYLESGWTSRTPIPYEGLNIGDLYFGHVLIDGWRVPAVMGNLHEDSGSIYVLTDTVRDLPIRDYRKHTKDDPETGLPVDYPGPGAEGNCLPHTPARTEDPTPAHQLPCLGTIQQYESYGLNNSKLVATNIFLPDNTVGITIDGGHVRIVTRVPMQDSTPYPGWRDPGGDPTRLHCDGCGVAHYPADLTDVYTGEGDDPPQALCPACLPAAPTPETPPNDAAACPSCFVRLTGEDILTKCPVCDIELAWSSQSGYDYYNPQDKLPVGNVTPEDLHTELFPGDEI